MCLKVSQIINFGFYGKKKKAKFFIHFDSLSSDETFFLSLSEISLFLSQFVDKETTVYT